MKQEEDSDKMEKINLRKEMSRVFSMIYENLFYRPSVTSLWWTVFSLQFSLLARISRLDPTLFR